jgi:hypothetical protein
VYQATEAQSGVKIKVYSFEYHENRSLGVDLAGDLTV